MLHAQIETSVDWFLTLTLFLSLKPYSSIQKGGHHHDSKKKKKKKKNGVFCPGQKLNRLLSPDIFENEFPPFICTKKKYWFPPFICTKAAGYLGGKFGD